MSLKPPKNKTRRTRRRDSRLGILVFCVLVVILMLIISPREPSQRALNITPEGKTTSAASGLRISEFMGQNTSALPDENGNFSDWLEVENAADHAIPLGGIALSNRPDRARFIFPNISLEPGERVIVFCDNTNQNEAGKHFHAKFKISSISASIYLFDSSGYVLDKVENSPTLNANEVYALGEDGQFAISSHYSPGHPNTLEGHQAYLAKYIVQSGILVINEISPAPRSGLRDEDGDLSDWVELKNNSDQPIDLSIIALSDNPDRPGKWFFPEGAVISPRGYYTVFCSGKDRENSGGYPHTNFSLSGEGETLTLSTRTGQLLDRVSYPIMPVDHSYGRNEKTGNWEVFTIGTPGAPNDATGFRMAENYMRANNPHKIFISEVMSSNDSTTIGPGLPISDWAELYNAGSEAVDLSMWGLSDSLSWPRKWQFPQGTYIWPGEYKVILLDKSRTPGTDAANLRGNFALKRAGGEVITLSDPDGRVLDRIVLPEIPTDISYGRTAASEGFYFFDTPTPGTVNGVGFVGFAQAPELSVQGGLYKENQVVSITGTEGGQIRYTLDGSIPTIDNSIIYTSPLTIEDTVVLRARTFQSGLQPSSVVTATYVMKTYFSVPVVSLVTDPDELWNEETGMLAVGKGIDINQYTKIRFRNPWPVYALHGKTHRPGYAEMFDDERGVMFSQGVTFGLIGQYSLDMPQKSFKVNARAKYGSKYFNVDLFEDRPFDQYKSLVLRVSGNDAVWTRMADGVQSRLVDQLDTTVINQAWKPVVVYLNGRYWGHYNLRERVSRYFVASHEGLPLEEADDMTILEGNSVSYWGSNTEYKEMLATAKTLSPGTSEADLKYLTDRIDIDNYFDYIIIQSFFANTDTGNIRYYKLPGGKWKWILFDLDYGLFDSTVHGIRVLLDPRGTGVNRAIDNTLIRKILENPGMQDKFLKRYGEIFRQLTTQVMLAQIDECYRLIQPEMNLHFQRWAEYNLKSISIEQPTTVDGALRFWNYRVDRMKNVVKKRPTLCWDQIKDWFKLTDAQTTNYLGPRPVMPADVI